jgi:hypothetical protein
MPATKIKISLVEVSISHFSYFFTDLMKASDRVEEPTDSVILPEVHMFLPAMIVFIIFLHSFFILLTLV